jgi:hypothetical protein
MLRAEGEKDAAFDNVKLSILRPGCSPSSVRRRARVISPGDEAGSVLNRFRDTNGVQQTTDLFEEMIRTAWHAGGDRGTSFCTAARQALCTASRPEQPP